MQSGAGNLEPESGNLLMAEITITPRATGIGAEVGGIVLGKNSHLSSQSSHSFIHSFIHP